jgi:sugar/nucleoside kinase (ribokinase family)
MPDPGTTMPATTMPAATAVPRAPGEARCQVVLCCGLTTLDLVQRVDHVPAANEKSVASDLSATFGGPAANAAGTVVALGLPARLLTAVGSGPVAELVRAELTAAGVEVVDLAAGTAAAPAVSTVLITESTGERAVVSVNATRTGELPPAPADVLDGVAVVLVDGHHLATALDVAARARTAGIPVVLDGGSWKTGLERLLPLVDHAIVSADFIVPGSVAVAGPVRSTEQSLQVIAGLGPRTVARTGGAGPIHFVEPQVRSGVRTIEVGSQVPVPVVDTVGAGDVLHGAFAAFAASHDRPVDVGRGLAFAAEIASFSVRFRGVRGWVAAYQGTTKG